MMGDSPAAVLFDIDGYEIDTTSYDGYNRLQVETSLATGTEITINNLPSPTVSDTGKIVREDVEYGGSNNLLVNGSVTPVVFTFDADVSDNILLYEVRFVFECNNIDVNGESFGSRDALDNGVKLEIRSNDSTSEVALLTTNEDFFKLYSPGGVTIDRAGTNDILVVGMFFGGAVKLYANSGDFVKVTIQDNLTNNTYKYFTTTVFGIKE